MSFEQLYDSLNESRQYKPGLTTVKPGELGKVTLRPGTDVEDLKAEILKSGWLVPISITDDGFIVDGVHRYLAMTELGFQEIPVYVGKQMGAAGRLESPYSGLPIQLDTLSRKA